MPISRTLSAWSAAGVSLALIAGGVGAVPALAAPDDITPISTATFEWGVNAVSQGTSNSGACSYFVAGIADGTDADYRSVEGNVTLLKRGASDEALRVTRENRCLPMMGEDSRQRALFTAGTGQYNATTGEAHIAWTGAFTVYSYGGLVPWYVKDPVLDVDGAGHGVIRATLGGSAGDPGGSGAITPLTPVKNATILELDNVSIAGNTITSTPRYAGVDYFPLNDPNKPASGRSTTSAISPATKAGNPTGWGAWPTDMVDFHYRSGLTTYWHSSGGSGDAKKVPYGATLHLAGGVPDYADIQPIRITQQPSGVQALTGDTVTLTAAATTNVPMTYQWQSASHWRGPWVDVEGATEPTLVLPNRQKGDATNYRLHVSADKLSADTTDVFVDVQDPAAPVEDSKPRNRVVYAGSQAFVTSGFTGYPEPVYVPQLSRDGGTTWANVLPGDGILRSRSMIVDAVPADWDGTRYRTLASNGVGPSVASSLGSFSVLPVPATPTLRLNVESHPAGTVFDVSKYHDIDVLGAGFGAPKTNLIYGIVPTAEWNARGADYLATNAIKRVEIEPGWNIRNGYFDRTLRPEANSLTPGVDYSAVLLSATAGDRSLDAAIALPAGPITAPVVTTQPTSVVAPVTPASGAAEAVFTAGITSSPLPTLNWQRSVDGGAWVDLAASGPQLRVAYTATNSGDRYRVAARVGSEPTVYSEPATLTVGNAAAITGQPAAPTGTVKAGDEVALTVAARGDDLTYRWERRAPELRLRGLASLWSVIPGADSATLRFTASPADSGAAFRAVVSGTVPVLPGGDEFSVTTEPVLITVGAVVEPGTPSEQPSEQPTEKPTEVPSELPSAQPTEPGIPTDPASPETSPVETSIPDATAEETSAAQPGSTGGLAHTGAAPVLPLLGAGVLLALGALIAARARRRTEA